MTNLRKSDAQLALVEETRASTDKRRWYYQRSCPHDWVNLAAPHEEPVIRCRWCRDRPR